MGLRFTIDINTPVPPGIDATYPGFNYYKLGVCCWVYDGYDGIIEWINTLKFCTESKYDNPTAFRWYLRPGVTGILKPVTKISLQLPDIQYVVPEVSAAVQTFNLLTGEGLPLLLSATP